MVMNLSAKEGCGKMELIRFNIHNFVKLEKPCVACIGYFDGIHIGHQALIKKVVETASANNLTPALITFDPDPWVVLKMLKDIPHITPMDERMKIANQLGIKKWIILEFEKDMAKLSVDDFHHLVLEPLNVHTLVCGYDFHYGNKGIGNTQTLKQQDIFKVEVVEAVEQNDLKISSTRIEECLRKGQVEVCETLMNRPYYFKGEVIKGNQLGRQYGYPTANLKLVDQYIVPMNGVYVCSVMIKDKTYAGIVNIGHNPSFNYQSKKSIEVFILDFNDDIYGEIIQVNFYKFIRNEQNFASMEALKAELNQNQLQAREYFKIRKDLLK